MPTRDPRVQPLIDATKRIMEGSNYDPHFAHVGEREIMETVLFLARFDALMGYFRSIEGFKIGHEGDLIPLYSHSGDPIPMILFCPKCGIQHIDKAEDHKPDCNAFNRPTDIPLMEYPCTCDRWTNPPHKSHLCHSCGWVWRPADVPTTGVENIATKGEHDEPEIRGIVMAVAKTEGNAKS